MDWSLILEDSNNIAKLDYRWDTSLISTCLLNANNLSSKLDSGTYSRLVYIL